MKTPRQILLEQNREHDSRLEAIQRNIITTAAEVGRVAPRAPCWPPAVSQVSKPAAGQTSNKPLIFTTLWSALILPARRIWLTYAFIWIAIIAFHFATSDHTTTQIAKTTNPSESLANWKEQQTILAELTKPALHEPIDRPKQPPMRPRSEASHTAMG